MANNLLYVRRNGSLSFSIREILWDKDRELTLFEKRSSDYTRNSAAELEAKKRKEAKRKEQEAREDKREAEYHAQENESGRRRQND